MPKIDEPKDLTALTQDLEDKSAARFLQYSEDERLWRLERYVLEEVSSLAASVKQQFPTFTGNDPRNLADLLIGMLVRYPLVAHGDLYEPTSETQEDELSAHERFASGVFRETDDLRGARGELPFQTDLSWFHCIRGGSLVRYWVFKDKDVEQPFRVDIWDPWDCVWQTGSTGLSFACHHYRAEESDVRESWPDFKKKAVLKADSDGHIEVWDGWWKDNGRVWNAVAIGNEWAKKPTDHTKERKLREIPVRLTRSLGAPLGPRVRTIGARKWITDQWESIYGANRDMYAQYNRAMTLYSLVIRDAPLGVLHHKLPRGTRPVEKLEEAIGPLKVVQTQGDLRHVDPVQIAPAAQEFVAAVSGGLQRGGAPYSAFGQAPFQLSGIALSQLQGAMQIRTARLSQSLGATYKAIVDGLIQQFININRKVTLSGLDRRQIPWRLEFTAQKLNKKYHLSFEHRTDLPIHQMQEANIAAVWAKLGVSLVRIYDELLHIQDPNWEYRRKLMEMADQNPVLAGLKLAREFRRKARDAAEAGDLDEATEYTEYAEIVMAQVKGAQQQAGQQAGGPTLPPPQAAPPEAFDRGGGYTENPQNVSQEARLAEGGGIGEV